MRTQLVIAAIIVFFLSTVNASAGNLEHEKIEFNYSEISVECETGLEIESWMTDDASWRLNVENRNVSTENVLEIEDWMTNDALWNANLDVETQPSTEEGFLAIESWMTNDTMWGFSRN